MTARTTVLVGDALAVLQTLDDCSVQCCVTSPPYWGLRDYGTATWEGGAEDCDHSTTCRGHGDEKQATSAGTSRDSLAGLSSCRKCGARRIDQQLGLESTPDEYVAKMVAVFREVRRVLRDDGTLFLNLGDSYASDDKWGGSTGGKHVAALHGEPIGRRRRFTTGLKSKDLVGIPWMVAFALRADGWYLRSDIIWSKPNPMPESVRDRPTKSHEYVFLLSKQPTYYYDAGAIAEPLSSDPSGWGRHTSKDPGARAVLPRPMFGPERNGRDGTEWGNGATRNARSVWSITTKPFSEAHFATMPVELAQRCIRAGSRPGDTVLDPFGGAGTTGLAAVGLARQALLIELNPEYAAMAERRITSPLFAEGGAA